ncbi:hypothetical protein HYFRA_00002696 [Hymenoscyphus fraxineus]|uniref:Histone-lysine N-methyltransferase SET5 n=1 Tax=Hymenoscyphus fraxineus TaxID=746836 RepID=A0A9N9LAW7_9HELO|nr:hypothetical protein HYFRA_00002696 [Hymenoscyphus fraxineus]
MTRPMMAPITPPPPPPPALYAQGFTKKKLAKGFASLFDDQKDDEKDANESTSTKRPELLSPIRFKDSRPSYRDASTQTEDLGFSVRNAGTQTGDNSHHTPGESNEYKENSLQTLEAESIVVTEANSAMVSEEIDTVMMDATDGNDATKAATDAGDVGDVGDAVDTSEFEETKLNEEEAKALLREQWLGTSKCARKLQQGCQLEETLALRQSLIQHLDVFPYNPRSYADLAAVYNQLGFTDVGTANAYKAILLTECALSDSATSYPSLPYLRTEVLNFMSAKHWTNSIRRIDHELNDIRSYAYRELLYGLMYCGAFWEGLVEARKALKLYPHDQVIKGFVQDLKGELLQRCEILAKGGRDKVEQATYAKRGSIYIIKYPWMDERLFYRTPEMLRQVNESLSSGSCEVRRVVFSTDSKEKHITKGIPEGMDIGALGVFATKDITKGEMVLVDPTLLGASNVKPHKRHQCDACQAFLVHPYFNPADKIYPKNCCKAVAYCSLDCRDAAAGMHSLLCGINIDYLYKDAKLISNLEKQHHGYFPRSILVARTIAVILADNLGDTHPLQHSLAARLVANYTLDGPHENEASWLFKECVVNPTKFLLQLGVDIFKSRDWDPEVIQTLTWRLDNNANMGVSSVYPPEDTSLIKEAKKQNIDIALNTVNVNPSYLFFNHSCLFNVIWNSSTECNDDIYSIEGMNGELLRPGSSAVRCFAGRDIKRGEELYISYLGEAGIGKSTKERKACRIHLEKWFKGGCGCAVCEEENKKAAEEGKDVTYMSEDEEMDNIGYDI